MKFSEWILQCLGIPGNGEYLDKLEEDFGVDAYDLDEEMVDEIYYGVQRRNDFYHQRPKPTIGNSIVREIYSQVVKRACDELEAKEDDFEYEVNSPCDHRITCKGHECKCWSDIEKLYRITNQDIIDICENAKFHIICISEEVDSFIRDNYTDGDSDGKFYKVYREGNDAKYGHYMINPHTMKKRNSTFNEFYGGGIVD